jgi:hypothetical protein
MTRARNLFDFKPSPEGLVEDNDLEPYILEGVSRYTPGYASLSASPARCTTARRLSS